MSDATPTSVYLYYDAADVLLYVGITSRGPRRQAEHNADKEWWRFVATQRVEHFDSRGVAAARERDLQHTVLYTVIDFRREVRGVDDHYGLGYETDEQVAEALHMFQHTEDAAAPRGFYLTRPACDHEWCRGCADVSYKTANHIRLDMQRIDGVACSWDGGAA